MLQLAPVPRAVQGLNGITCSATMRGASGGGGGSPGVTAVWLSSRGSAALSLLGGTQLRCCCWARGARLGAALAQRGAEASSVIVAAVAAVAATVARAR